MTLSVGSGLQVDDERECGCPTKLTWSRLKRSAVEQTDRITHVCIGFGRRPRRAMRPGWESIGCVMEEGRRQTSVVVLYHVTKGMNRLPERHGDHVIDFMRQPLYEDLSTVVTLEST